MLSLILAHVITIWVQRARTLVSKNIIILVTWKFIIQVHGVPGVSRSPKYWGGVKNFENFLKNFEYFLKNVENFLKDFENFLKDFENFLKNCENFLKNFENSLKDFENFQKDFKNFEKIGGLNDFFLKISSIFVSF